MIEYINNFKEYEFIIPIITLLSGIIPYLSRKFNKYFSNIRNEKIIKNSESSHLFLDRFSLICLQLLYSFIAIIVVGLIFVFASLYFNELNKWDHKVVFLIVLLISIVLFEVFNHKILNNYKAFFMNLTGNIIRKIINILLFFSPRIILNGILIIYGWYDIESNFASDFVLIGIFVCLLITLIRYFDASATYERYSKVKIYFINSFSVCSCDYKDFSITESYVIIKNNTNIVKLEKYNANIISKIEYIGNTEFQKEYEVRLLKRGFLT